MQVIRGIEMAGGDKAFNSAMRQLYSGLVNAWQRSAKDAYRDAVQLLSNMDKSSRSDSEKVNALLEVIADRLGDDFAADANKFVKAGTEKAMQIGLVDVKREVGVSISWDFENARVSKVLGKQNHFWLRDHFNSSVSNQFKTSLEKGFSQGASSSELADILHDQFKHISKSGMPYFQGLAEHTSLRMRQFGRMDGYVKAGIKYYEIRAILDDRTSDICRAMHGKRFPVSQGVNLMEQMQSIDIERLTPEEAKARLKSLAPWARESDVIYDTAGRAVDIAGNFVPFPPFHWRCRTRTRAVV